MFGIWVLLTSNVCMHAPQKVSFHKRSIASRPPASICKAQQVAYKMLTKAQWVIMPLLHPYSTTVATYVFIVMLENTYMIIKFYCHYRMPATDDRQSY